MSVFEDYLRVGYWLNDGQRLAIYKFFIKTKSHSYKAKANKLMNEKFLLESFANGEIAYSLHRGVVSFKARKIGEVDFDVERRSVKLSKVRKVSIKRLVKFFAQAEVDVLRNYPIPNNMELEERGYAMNVYPYYDLNYFSNGAGKARGLLMKIQSKDDQLLEKLLTSGRK
jgi:hypothetical protein